jgi:hypothetical protein
MEPYYDGTFRSAHSMFRACHAARMNELQMSKNHDDAQIASNERVSAWLSRS